MKAKTQEMIVVSDVRSRQAEAAVITKPIGEAMVSLSVAIRGVQEAIIALAAEIEDVQGVLDNPKVKALFGPTEEEKDLLEMERRQPAPSVPPGGSIEIKEDPAP